MFARLFPPKQEARATFDQTWGTWPGDVGGTWSGAPVTVDSSLQLLAVYGCVQMICDMISTLPVDTYRRLSDGTSVEIPKPAWLKQPTVDLDFVDWCGQVLSSLLLHGNAYVAVLRNQTGAIVELIPLDPTVVVVKRQSGRKVFQVNGQDYPGEILHVKGLMLPGSDVGLSPVEYARQSIGLGLSAQEYGANFFDREGNMPGVIEIPKPTQPGVMTEMAKLWKKQRSKSNRGLPGVLSDGAQWKPTGVTNEQAQFLATRQFTAAEIAGQMFLLDPSDLGIGVPGTSLTYANLEQRNVRRVQVTLLRWIVRLEAAISALLYNPRYMKFNVEGLLRGDTLNRYQSYAVGITNGFLLPEEARELEDLPPLAGQAPPPEAPNAA